VQFGATLSRGPTNSTVAFKRGWCCVTSADCHTLGSCVCYCRIVVAGSLLQSSVVPGSAAPFDFQAAYGLSNEMVSIFPGHTAFFVDLRKPMALGQS